MRLTKKTGFSPTLKKSLWGPVISPLVVACCLNTAAYATANTQAATSIDNLPAGLAPAVARSLSDELPPSYHLTKTATGFQTSNSSHAMQYSFGADGLQVKSTTGGWNWGLKLTAWGNVDAMQPVTQKQPVAEKTRLEYRHSSGLTEWYLNTSFGLEQGFTLHEPLTTNTANNEVAVEMAISGNLQPKLASATSLLLNAQTGQTMARYTGLHAYDVNGQTLPAEMRLAGCEADSATNACRLQLVVNTSDAVYPLTIDPWLQRAKLTAKDGATGDHFGGCVAVSGDTVVVGAYQDDDHGSNSGSAYVFVKPESGWATASTYNAKLTASDGAEHDQFGNSVAISDDTVVVGANYDDDKEENSGSAYVFVKPESGWITTSIYNTKLTASDGAKNDQFGSYSSVAISDDTVVVGAHKDDDKGKDSGSAYIFVIDNDGDGVNNVDDNCPNDKNPDQKNTDKDKQGDVCDTDDDNDNVPDYKDNSQFVPNQDQKDTDGDGIGDVSDTDDDNDGVPDHKDNSRLVYNPAQKDTDGDNIGDVSDNCLTLKNPDQKDTDNDGSGDVCEAAAENKAKEDAAAKLKEAEAKLATENKAKEAALKAQKEAEAKLAAALKAQKIAVKDIQLGFDHSCLLTTTGNVKCWGSNKYGQLGDGTTEAQKKPVTTVSGLSGVRAIAVGAYHSCALTTTGGVKCWGQNEYGQLGNGEFGKDKYKNGPVPVSGLNGVREIVLGYSYSCALTTTGKVKCWGRNYYGQLGSGNDKDQPYPAESNYLSGVRALGAGTHHSCVVTKTGNVMCLGAGESGQFGDGTFTEWRVKSEKVLNLSGVRAVALGNYHSCALTTTGGVKCWGSNQYGQLGDGTTTGKKKGKNKPVKVDLSSVRAIELGNHHSCALTTTDVMCWGENDVGQLGDNTSKQQNKPVKVFGLSGVSAIAVGAHHSCALTMTGGVKCWGYNFSGQLGNGRNINSEIPVDVQLDSN